MDVLASLSHPDIMQTFAVSYKKKKKSIFIKSDETIQKIYKWLMLASFPMIFIYLYYLHVSDYCLHFGCYINNILAIILFRLLQVSFLLVIFREYWTKPFIQFTRADYFHSAVHALGYLTLIHLNYFAIIMSLFSVELGTREGTHNSDI